MKNPRCDHTAPPRSLALARALFAAVAGGAAAGAQGPAPAAVDREPLLRMETDGPTSLVTGLAFRPDGRALYEAGWDKVVRVWALDDRTGRFTPDPRATLR